MTKSDILNNYVFKSLDESSAMCVELTEEPIPGFKTTESGKRRCGRAILVTEICSKWEVKKKVRSLSNFKPEKWEEEDSLIATPKEEESQVDGKQGGGLLPGVIGIGF